MTDEEYIRLHRGDDVRVLALKKGPEGVDVPWCLQQIEGWQLAQKKLPRWGNAEGLLWFPPKLSMEQCSSESTAHYKQQLVERILPAQQRGHLIDLTGGFGIDFSFLASLFERATYVERQEHLCEIARHNLPLLGLEHAEILQTDCTSLSPEADVFFLDPARRDTAGRKTVAIQDCTPDVVELQDRLLSHARYILLKLSPMLDITQATRALRNVVEVHVVSVRGECKELLLVMRGEGQRATDTLYGDFSEECHYYCVNLDTDDDGVDCAEEERASSPIVLEEDIVPQIKYVFEPNASLLKAGCQDILCGRYGLRKLHPCSNLFLGEAPLSGFPGRQFRVEAVSDFGKKGLKAILADVKQANLTVRNFPAAVADLRKKLRLREGGDIYFFATTLHDGRHALIKCSKA